MEDWLKDAIEETEEKLKELKGETDERINCNNSIN